MGKKKIFFLAIIFLVGVILFPTKIYAAKGYDFKLEDTGDLIENQEKTGKVMLVGVNGETFTNVVIKIEVSGPAKPKLLAVDSNGTEIDIGKTGYWGPPSGFPIQGNFTNTTPIKATFPQKGMYTIVFNLLDVKDSNKVITSKTFQINVLAQPVMDSGNGQPIEELPQTGNNLMEYLLYILPVILIIVVVVIAIRERKNKK